MARMEFSRAVKVEIIKRSRGSLGFPQCEQCRTIIVHRFEIHHKKMDAMNVDKKKLTAQDGILLCPKCHLAETKEQMPILAKAKRIEAKHLGAVVSKQKIQSRGFPKSQKNRPAREPVPRRPIYE